LTALFTTAMALREVDADGVYRVFEGELNKHWTIGPKVHGGALTHPKCARKAPKCVFVASFEMRACGAPT
jgi:hypothetical protein